MKPHAFQIALTLSGALLFSTTLQAESSTKKTANIKTQIAIEYIKIGNLDAAKNSLDEALKLAPRNAVANMTMGLTYQLVGTEESAKTAKKYFKKAVAIEPKNPQIRNNYGQFLFVTKDYKEAIEHFKIAANTLGYGSRDSAFNNLGHVYLDLNNLDEAKNNFLRALQINTKNTDALHGLAETYYMQDNIAAANSVFDDLLSITNISQLNSKALWLKIRLEKINGELISLNYSIQELLKNHPKSKEAELYSKLKDIDQKW